GKVPDDINREQLRQDLHGVRREHLVFSAHTKTPLRRRQAAAKRIIAHTSALIKTLDRPPDFVLDWSLWPVVGTSRHEILSILQTLRKSAKQFKRPAQPAASPTRWLVQQLAPIYRKHFKQRPGRARTIDGELYGAFPNFVMAAGKEMGVSMSIHTVDAAIKSMGKKL